MEKKHIRRLKEKFGQQLQNKTICAARGRGVRFAFHACSLKTFIIQKCFCDTQQSMKISL
jgi:hypothetical protein